MESMTADTSTALATSTSTARPACRSPERSVNVQEELRAALSAVCVHGWCGAVWCGAVWCGGWWVVLSAVLLWDEVTSHKKHQELYTSGRQHVSIKSKRPKTYNPSTKGRKNQKNIKNRRENAKCENVHAVLWRATNIDARDRHWMQPRFHHRPSCSHHKWSVYNVHFVPLVRVKIKAGTLDASVCSIGCTAIRSAKVEPSPENKINK